MTGKRRRRGPAGRAGRVLAGLLATVLSAAGGPPRASFSEAGVVDFDAFLAGLASRSSLYEKAALGFSCEETVTQGKFGKWTGENKKEEKTRYDYLYEGNPETGYQEIRLLVAKNDLPRAHRPVDLDLDVPGAYDWALLFTDLHRPHFRFEMEGQELLGPRLAVVMAFYGATRFDRGRTIEEWSGRVWLDRETLNFLKISATPNGQADLLPILMDKWLKSVRLGAVLLKRQPRGYRYELAFTVDKFGLTFPGEAETREFVLTPQGEEETRQRTEQVFRNYVFFSVASDEEFHGTDGQAGKGSATASPPSPPPTPKFE